MLRPIALAGALLTLISALPVDAQIPAAPRELGMGGAYLGLARGYESIFLSPANLALPGAPAWSVALPQVAIGGTLLGPGARDLVDLVQFNELATDRQEELLSLIPSSGTVGSYSLRAPLAAFSFGAMGGGVSYSSVGSHTLSRDLAELFLRGYEEGRTHYAVGNTSGDRATYWDFALAYAWNDGPWSIGVATHYLRGATLVRTQLFEPRIDLDARDLEVDYVGVISRGGSGRAVDLSAAYQASPALTMSMTVSNAYSSMKWSEDLHYRTLTLDREMIDTYGPLDMRSQYQYSELPVDPAAVPTRVEATASGLYDEAEFPAIARIGLGYRAGPTTRLAADFHRKIGSGRLGDPWDRRLAVGIDQSVWILGFRAGYAIGNDGGNMLGGGFSLGPLDVGVARYRQSAPDDLGGRGWIGTFGLGIAQPF